MLPNPGWVPGSRRPRLFLQGRSGCFSAAIGQDVQLSWRDWASVRPLNQMGLARAQLVPLYRVHLGWKTHIRQMV